MYGESYVEYGSGDNENEVTPSYNKSFYINDKKIGVKETNLISEKIYIDSKLDTGRNKISIIAIDRNDFKTAKNFYITRDET